MWQSLPALIAIGAAQEWPSVERRDHVPLARRDDAIRDEVAAARHFGKILGAADERNRIKTRMQRATEESLPTDCRSERHQGDRRANIGNRSAQPTS